ncbi:hypothetical protein CTEN210_08974 [Chaetoceros tenuissimus]|uniref:Peptidase M50B-like protein n=1 Tax=Chaetoceros tenuissimus TaxID=426638 RepID=A0AAD3CV28_9STRA|nr:hypothetical protein CTEN210_08974 [Chaetoceros tenuissimus]
MNDEQSAFVVLYAIYLLIAIATNHTFLAYPLRLLTTFVHEFSHAVSCWMTGGYVHEIEVYDNGAGITRYRGGCRCLISSAGFLGEAIWGMFFVVLSGGRKTATFAACVLITCLLTSLCYNPNRTMVLLVLFYSISLFTVIWIEWYVYTPLIHYVILFFGVFMSFIAVEDIFGHTVVQARPGSDAYALYEDYNRCPCCWPRCVGFSWFILAILLQITAFVLTFMLMSEECKDQGWMECIFHTKIDFGDWNFDWDLFH